MKNILLMRLKRSKIFFFVVILLLSAGLWLLSYDDYIFFYYADRQVTNAPQGEVSIMVNTSSRMLELYDDGRLHKNYRIAVGKTATPTPIGEWNIVYKSYSPEEKFGTRWMGLNIPWGSYGIHGTNAPWSIGSFASHGCIRMRNKDAEELYEWVPIGTAVTIKGPRAKVARTLSRNSTGVDVVVLQLRLIELGYFQSRADGCFGWETEAAVRAFQRDKGLTETGIVDKRLQKMLGI